MKYFDAHCHLYFPQYDADREETLSHMRALDLGAVIVGTDLETSNKALEMGKEHDFLWSSVGLHPTDEGAFDEEEFTNLAQESKVVAIGECGLDYFRTGKTAEERAIQLKRFESHIQLAVLVHKPLIIHCRDAHEDMVTTLTSHRRDHGNKLQTIVHFFTGTAELAQRYLDLGCYLSFPGPITFTDAYDESVKVTPMDKILVETDSPFAAPMPHRGKRNEPAFVLEVIRKIAALKGLSEEEVAAQTVKNARNIFGLH
ncbi:TatD family hydrolase [Candidatus Parcubacteria bacterium]|nr:TatD family hydrolase [Candidatus Parcubacteria bacterium]